MADIPDAFVAAITVALLEGMAPADALTFACAAGAFAAQIPYEITWAHELADAPEGHNRFAAMDNLGELPQWLSSHDHRSANFDRRDMMF